MRNSVFRNLRLQTKKLNWVFKCFNHKCLSTDVFFCVSSFVMYINLSTIVLNLLDSCVSWIWLPGSSLSVIFSCWRKKAFPMHLLPTRRSWKASIIQGRQTIDQQIFIKRRFNTIYVTKGPTLSSQKSHFIERGGFVSWQFQF